MLFDFSDQSRVSPGLAHVSDAQVLSIDLTYPWNTEDELESFSLELSKRVFQELERMLTVLSQIIPIIPACLFMGRVTDMTL